MQTKLLNYHILVEPDERMGTDEPCYTSFCPILGLSESGDTAEEAVENMKKLILFHLESLRLEDEEIPEPQRHDGLLVSVQVPFPHAA